MIAAAALASIPFFASFDPAELSEIAHIIVQRTYPPGAVIFLEDEPNPGLFFVQSGRVKVYKLSLQGKEQVLCVMQPRTCFGACPLFDGDANPATAQAIDEVTLCFLGKDETLALAERRPEAAQVLLKVFAGRLRHLAGIVEGLSFKCVTSRLAETLLTYADEDGTVTEDGIEVNLGMSHGELAALLGSVREVVTRALLRLERIGAIEATGRRVVILDRARLERLV
jgi:CRP/FNR family transcriptional regulator